MFDIGWSEMAIIMVLALIIIGPKDLPRVARTIGQWVRKGRMLAREFQSSLEDMAKEAELDDVKKEIEKVGKTDLKKAVETSLDPKGELKSAFDTSDSTPGEETVGKVLNGNAAAKAKEPVVPAGSSQLNAPASPQKPQTKPKAKAGRSSSTAKKPAPTKKAATSSARPAATTKSGTGTRKAAVKKQTTRKRAAKPAASTSSGSDASSADKDGGSSAMAAKSS